MTISDDTKAGSQHCLPFSLVFPGKVICAVCGLPASPQNVSPRGFCMSCEDEVITAATIATVASKVPQRGFKEALAEVRKAGRPLTLDIAEAAMEQLGGADQLGKMMVDDLKRIRGDHLNEEQRAFHDVDYKVLRGLYDTLVKLAKDRDSLVGETGDPLDGISDSDLSAIAAQAAIIQIEVDKEFRSKILDIILQFDPQAVVEAAGKALDILDSQPKVEVLIDGKPA